VCVKFLLKKNTHERRSVKEEASGLKMKTALARREATEKSRQRHSNRAKKDLLQRNPHISYEEWQKLSRYAHLKPMKREEWTRAFSRCGKNSSVEEEEEKKKEEETRREDRDDIERFKSESNIASRSLASRKPLSSLQTHTNERTDTEENLRLFCSEIKTFDQFNRAWRDFEREEEKREKMLTFVFETDARGECIAETLFKAKCIETWMLEEMLCVLLSSPRGEEEWRTEAAKRLISHLSTPLQVQMLSTRAREKLRERKLSS